MGLFAQEPRYISQVYRATLGIGILSTAVLAGYRKTVLSVIVANSLHTGCQGVDLRSLHRTFIASMENPTRQLLAGLFPVSHHQFKKEQLFNAFWK